MCVKSATRSWKQKWKKSAEIRKKGAGLKVKLITHWRSIPRGRCLSQHSRSVIPVRICFPSKFCNSTNGPAGPGGAGEAGLVRVDHSAGLGTPGASSAGTGESQEQGPCSGGSVCCWGVQGRGCRCAGCKCAGCRCAACRCAAWCRCAGCRCAAWCRCATWCRCAGAGSALCFALAAFPHPSLLLQSCC